MSEALEPIGFSSASTLDNLTADKDVIFDFLASCSVTHVYVDFDGGGDEGSIENIVAKAGDDEVDLTGNVTLIGSRMDIESAIHQVGTRLLDHDSLGWENGEGAFGSIVFDVAARTVAVEFQHRFIDYNIEKYQH